MFVDLRDRPCLVVGGGVVATRKAEALLRAGARVRMVAPQLADAAQRWIDAGIATVRAGRYESTDLDGVVVAIAATDDAQINARVASDARARAVAVNVVDCPELSTFIVPALVDRSPVIVAISSGGAAPVLARTVRGKLEAVLPANLGALASVCERLRVEVKARVATVERRRAFWERALESHGAELAVAGQTAEGERELRALLDAYALAGEHVGELACVGVGPGDPDLLSFRAQRAMLRAELVVTGPDVPASIVELCRRDAERFAWAGLAVGEHETLLSELAARIGRGQRVCVLARGDAFRSGRGAAFVALAGARGVRACVVPGIGQVE